MVGLVAACILSHIDHGNDSGGDSGDDDEGGGPGLTHAHAVGDNGESVDCEENNSSSCLGRPHLFIY